MMQPINYGDFCKLTKLTPYDGGSELGSSLEVYELYIQAYDSQQDREIETRKTTKQEKNIMKYKILANITSCLAITQIMEVMAAELKFIEDADGNDALWFTYNGEAYGVSVADDGAFSIIDCEGNYFYWHEDWIEQNYELVEVLKAAYKTYSI